MPNKNNPEISPEDDLRAENEVKKLRLEMEQGAVFGGNFNEIPPEVEKQFLDNIFAFEKQYAENVKISVYDFIGKPEIMPTDKLKDDEIKMELEKMYALLSQNGLALDVLADYENEDRLIYTFIVEELFSHMIDDIRIPGWVCNFIYEEFHPNHQYDIRNRCDEFIEYVFRDKYPGAERFDEFVFQCNEMYVSENDSSPYPKKISPSLTNFFNAFPSRTLNSFKIRSIENDNEFSLVKFLINYDAYTEINEPVHFSGHGQIIVVCEYDYWCIKKVDMPGLEIK
ncbi:MAG: hypothetical protein ACHQFW_01130 [Chitinophagales bacterium]